MGNLMVLTGQAGIRPYARNILRATGLLVDCTVSFREGREQSIRLDIAEAFYPRAETLLKVIHAADPKTPVDAKLTSAGIGLLDWLCDETGRSEHLEEALFAALLEEVRRQSVYYLAGDPPADFDAFWSEWDKNYPRPQAFKITGASIVNSTNKSEADDYLAAHQKADAGVGSIDNAIESLLSTLPNDVESILDIGSGPGYVNRHLPVDVSVLAMDITETILQGNQRQSCVGDIMDIPLADSSVDMIMACDMLEHLPDDVLKKGMAELERVSRKYLYLQVPFQEDPVKAIAFCPNCRNVWHVNHHKRFFDEQKLTALVSEKWKPVCVNYTGEVSMRRKELLEARIAYRLGWNVFCVEDADCPNCGAKSRSMNAKERKMLQHLAEFDADCPFPAYTEIGILFCRADQDPELQEDHPVKTREWVQRARNVLVPSPEPQLEKVYTALEMVPEVYVQGCRMESAKEKFSFIREDETETAWVAVAFPALMPRYNSIEVTGCTPDGPATVSVAVLDAEGKEVYVCEWEWNAQQQTYSLPKPEGYGATYIKLYFRAKQFVMLSCRMAGAEDVPYWFCPGEQPRVISFTKGAVRYRILKPNKNGICLSHRPAEWVRFTNELEQRQQTALMRFAQAVTGTDQKFGKADNRSLIRSQMRTEGYIDSLCGEAARYTDDKNKPNEMALQKDGRLAILDSLLASEVILDTSVSAHGTVAGATTALRDTRLVIVDSVIAETTMRLYDEVGPTALQRKSIAVLGRGKRALHGWLRRHSRLYEFLIALGLKDVYYKMKRRIKS